MKKYLAAVITAAVLATLPTPASAERPRADVTPGCVDAYEYNHSAWLDTKAEIDAFVGEHGWRTVMSGEIDLMTGEPYPMRSKRYVKFTYPACDGEMFIIYERPNAQHPHSREWVHANYIDN